MTAAQPHPLSGLPSVLAVLGRLAARRPLFHSEADLQFEYASELRSIAPEVEVRLERPHPTERGRLDLLATLGDRSVAIEFKYLIRGIDAEVAGERYRLLNQGAHDIRRYDVIKDLNRVEQLVVGGFVNAGYVVVVTNDSGYWTRSLRQTVDAAFRLHDGAVLDGIRSWAEHAGPGTIKKREEPIGLRGRYEIAWVDYSTVGASTFRALVLEASTSR